MAANKKFFILTGDPGIGKTTLAKKLASFLSENGVKAFGFYTEEIRRNGVREGFDIVSLNGDRGRLARDQSLLAYPVKCKVGKYGVLVQEFEKVALPCLAKPVDMQSFLVIDEIGKMEFFSEAFKSRVRDVFSDTSYYIILATIPNRKSVSLIENIRNHNKAKVWTVTRENRNKIHEEILRDMLIALNINEVK